MTASAIPGLHHVTAIAGDPSRTIAFYTEVLGLRLVKKTINFDDPGTYHFYFGDRVGTPGTIISFFPWPSAGRGQKGFGQPRAIGFAVPVGSLDSWRERLTRLGVAAGEPRERLGESVIAIQDPDGNDLELVAVEELPEIDPWIESSVAPAQAIHGLHSVTLWVLNAEGTLRLLTETLGLEATLQSGERFRLRIPTEEEDPSDSGRQPASFVDVVETGDAQRGGVGVGTIHHVAFRVREHAEQVALRGLLLGAGMTVTPIINRQYFQSIYFREPGGVLLEVATDPPGFTIDEAAEELGASLKLPPQYEPARERIEQLLPPLSKRGWGPRGGGVE